MRMILFACFLIALSAPAAAQGDCILDRCGRPRETPPRSAAAPPSGFDFYMLALSWSPGFCETAGDRDRRQCAPGARLGFVVHGLWPQNERSSPQNCAPGQRAPSRADVAQAAELFPSEGLARYQWRKHGSCTGLAPSAYFAEVRRAREAVRIPDMFTRGGGRAAPEEILRAFRDANPRLLAGMAAVSCPRNVLQEVRVCMSRDLRAFVPCPEVVSRSCRARDIDVPPPL